MTPHRSHHRHVPQRTCVGCRETLDKRSLIRIVRTEDGVKIDPSGKAPGRGAYVHDQRSCWEAALKGSLARALKTDVDADDRNRLLASLESLVDGADG